MQIHTVTMLFQALPANLSINKDQIHKTFIRETVSDFYKSFA